MNLPFLDCSHCIAFRSLIISIAYFSGHAFSTFLWISLRVASINVSMLRWLLGGIHFLFVRFLNLCSSEKMFFYLFWLFILKWARSFVRLKRYSNFLFIIYLLLAFFVRTILKFLIKFLKVSLKLFWLFRLISWPARSNWNLILSSSVFCDLIKLPLSVVCYIYFMMLISSIFSSWPPLDTKAWNSLFSVCMCVQCFSFFCFFLVIVLCLF